ncbi:O-antigen ligase family protein [Candidatus Pelagibacter sp.]|nr:O-antigen ligase family protein [Candidatus Pelagibacter sp.]
MKTNTIHIKKNFLETVIYSLIVLLPVSLVSGPFLSDLSVSIISVIFIYLSFKKKLYFYYKNIFSKIFGIFFLILLLTSFFSLDPIISFKKTIFYFRFWIFALAVWHISTVNKKLIQHLILSFTIIFFILIVDGFVQFFFEKNILGWPIQGASRLSSLFKDELILGSYLSRLLPIYFGLLVLTNFDKKIYKYILFFIIFVGVEALIFMSGERVAFFFINASSLMLIITLKNYKSFRIFSIIASIILIIFLINIYPQSTNRIFNKTFNQMGLSDKKNNSQIYIFSMEHQNHYTSAIRMFKDNIITGVGPRMFRHKCGEKKYNIFEGCSTHPHNTYVQLLAETGLIGLIFSLSIFFITIFYLIKHLVYKHIKKKLLFNDYQLCLLSAILISIWPFVPTGGIFNNWLNIIYFFPVGLFLNSIYNHKKSDYN